MNGPGIDMVLRMIKINVWRVKGGAYVPFDFLFFLISDSFCYASGRGVFSKETFLKGDFLLEYRGNRIVQNEAPKKNSQFMFGFRHDGKHVW